MIFVVEYFLWLYYLFLSCVIIDNVYDWKIELNGCVVFEFVEFERFVVVDDEYLFIGVGFLCG